MNDGDGGNGEAIEHVDRRIDPILVSDAVLGAGKIPKLAYIRASDERGLSGSPENDGIHGAVDGNRRANALKLVIHLEGHGVARLWPIEDDRCDAPADRAANGAIAHPATTPLFKSFSRAVLS